MNVLHEKSILLFISLVFFLSACSKVGGIVSSTGDLVSKTGELIGGKEEIKAPELPEVKLPEIPKVIEIKEVKAATAKAQIKISSKLSQSRINVTIVQLKSGGKFLSSRLSDLDSDAENTLGNDFISKQNISLKKGEGKVLDFEIDASTKLIGAFASFRELNQTVWRTSVPLSKVTDTSYNIQINVDEKSISVKSNKI